MCLSFLCGDMDLGLRSKIISVRLQSDHQVSSSS